MNVRKIVLSLSLILIFVLSACSGAAATTPAMREKPTAATEVMADTGSTDAMRSEKTSGAMMDEATPDAMMEGSETPDAMMESPAFFDATLTDASSMQSFTMKDFQGKVVLVETLAMWCSNCLQQQKQVKALHAQLGERDDFVSVGLDIDPNEEIGPLKSYVEKNGFDWTYAIAPPEVSREIGQRYGQQFLNPTSTPMFIIDRHGQVHTLPFGIKSAESLKEALNPFLNAGM